MRIGLLTTSFPQYPGDPSGCFVLGFAQALAQRGHTVEVLAPASGTQGRMTRRPDLGPRVTLSPVSYSWPQHRQKLFGAAGVPEELRRAPWLAPQLGQFTAALALASYQRRHAWDAVVSHWALPCALVAVKAVPALPHLAVCHSADVHALCRYPGGKLLRKRLRKNAHALWFVSEQMRKRFSSGLSGTTCRTHVSPMGYWPQTESHSHFNDKAAHASVRRLRVATLGRLVPIKGVANAIAATSNIPELELHIAGDGPELGHLRQLTNSNPRIRFHGQLNEFQKWEHLRNADIFLLSSRTLKDGRSEGAPVALLEAMHCKLPIVATKTGSVPSLIRDRESGLLVAPDSPAHITRALRELVSSSELRRSLGAEAHRQVRQFEWPELGRQAEALLTNKAM